MKIQVTRADLVVLGFTLLYLALATPVSLASRNYEFLIYIGAVLAIVPAVAVVHLRMRLGQPLLWALSFWGLLHMLGGLVSVPDDWPIQGQFRVLYSLWLIEGRLKFDHLVHAYGFGTTTWLCWQVLDRLLRQAAGRPQLPTRPSAGLLALCVAGGMGFGALNELIEFMATLLLPATNVGGYENTGWDLTANLAGGLLAAAAIRLYHRQTCHTPKDV